MVDGEEERGTVLSQFPSGLMSRAIFSQYSTFYLPPPATPAKETQTAYKTSGPVFFGRVKKDYKRKNVFRVGGFRNLRGLPNNEKGRPACADLPYSLSGWINIDADAGSLASNRAE